MSDTEREGVDAEGRPSLGAAMDFLRLLWEVEHALDAASKRTEALVGVTGPQRLVLRIIARFPGIAAGKIAGFLHLHPSTVTGVLQRLEARGLVARKSDPADARRALFQVTPKARRIVELQAGELELAVGRVLQRHRELVQPTRKLLRELSKALYGAASSREGVDGSPADGAR